MLVQKDNPNIQISFLTAEQVAQHLQKDTTYKINKKFIHDYAYNRKKGRKPNKKTTDVFKKYHLIKCNIQLQPISLFINSIPNIN